VLPRKPFWRASVEREVYAEVAFHLELATRELMERGLSRRDADAEARRRFGDAVRQLLRARAFTITAVVTLGLGLGATATMFSAVDAVVLRALPFADQARIVAIHPRYEGVDGSVAPPELLAYEKVDAFEYVAGARLGGGATLQLGELPEMVDAANVSASYFAVLGVRPQLGRTFSAEEDRANGPQAAILSHRFWVSHFNSDPSVLNRVVRMNDQPTTIVGVMPESFDYVKGSPNIWQPLALSAEDATRYGAHYLHAFARFRPGVTVEQARAATTAAERGVAEHMEHLANSVAGHSLSGRRVGRPVLPDCAS